MAPRLELQSLLTNLLGSDKVYFQPPPTVKMEYPCIVYKRDDIMTRYADDDPYTQTVRYQVTVIDKNPDSVIPLKVSALRTCAFDRHYTSDNLNHDVFKLYF